MTLDWTGKTNRKHFLRHLIEKHDVRVMAEVGVRDGRTMFFLLDHCPNLCVYAIDRNIALFRDRARNYRDRVIAVEGDSSSVAQQFAASCFDLVFIDADHSYAGVCRDIRAYRPRCRDSGIFCGHDIDYPGVNRAVKELIVNYDVGPNFVWVAKT